MSFQLNVPPSVISKLAKEDKQESTAAVLGGTAAGTEEEPAGKKREDWRKLKELEEARKAGTAPAMQDEEGKDINPHIPQYIMQAPWYFGAMQPTLKHQREPDYMKKKFNKMTEWYKKGVKADSVATKYRKGACENCGAMTHKKKDCLERPRKIGARFTGDDIAPDEYIQPQLEFDFDGKRDRWNGYDVTDHDRVLEEFQKREDVKRQLKAMKMEKALLESSTTSEDAAAAPSVAEAAVAEDEEDEDEKYADDMEMPGQKFETKQRITVRNLRIREDTAKYLFNLDPNSAYYDPKTRSMRENPFAEKGQDPRDLPYAGDNFVRWSGDAHAHAKNQLFSWEAYEKGTEAHLQADPTKLEILQREYGKKKENYKETMKSSILDKYGGEEHLNSLPRQLLVEGQTENYVEYTRHGTLRKGQEKAKVKSRYEEDIYERNHTSIWGSYWKEGRWGYACCHSLIRQSYCVGETGKELERQEQEKAEEERKEAETKDPKDRLLAPYDPNQPKSLLQQHLEKRVAEEKSKKAKEKEEKKKAQSSDSKNKKKGSRSSNKNKGKVSADDKKEDDDETSSSSSSSSSSDSSESDSSCDSSDSSSTESSSSDSEEDKKKKKQKGKSNKNKKSYKKKSKKKNEKKDDKTDKEKLKEAIAKEENRLKEVEEMMKLDEKKRPYNVMYDGKGPSEEDIEAFQMKRQRYEDPMLNYRDSDDD